jgi:hypothetical protein
VQVNMKEKEHKGAAFLQARAQRLPPLFGAETREKDWTKRAQHERRAAVC